jgi:hypothetical protein
VMSGLQDAGSSIGRKKPASSMQIYIDIPPFQNFFLFGIPPPIWGESNEKPYFYGLSKSLPI